MSTTTTNVQLDPTKLYGILHDNDGAPIERRVRYLKLGFAVPTGPDLHVILKPRQENPWVIEAGQYNEQGKRLGVKKHEFPTKVDAYKAYRELREETPERKAPRKFPYFTFLRMGPDGKYWHDFDAIEAHGSYPTEVDVVFLTEKSFEAAMQKWTASALQCQGDGRNAKRRVDFTPTKQDEAAAAVARAAGEQWFPIVGGCLTGGCVYAQGDKPECKPHGRLYFQLPSAPRIGSSCTYDTTSRRSIPQISSCIREIKTNTGGGDPERGYIAGIPLKLVMQPYTSSKHKSIQYAVSLQAEGENAVALVHMLNQSTREFRAAALLPAPPPVEGVHEAEDVTPDNPYPDEGTEAGVMNAEFYGDFEGQDDDDDGFDDNESVQEQPLNMPRRKSDTSKQ